MRKQSGDFGIPGALIIMGVLYVTPPLAGLLYLFYLFFTN